MPEATTEGQELFDLLRRNPFANDPNAVTQENPISGGNIQPAAWATTRIGTLVQYDRRFETYWSALRCIPYTCPAGKEAEIWVRSSGIGTASVTPVKYIIYDSASYTEGATLTAAVWDTSALANFGTNNYQEIYMNVKHRRPTTYALGYQGYDIQSTGYARTVNGRLFEVANNTTFAVPSWAVGVSAYKSRCAWHPDGRVLFTNFSGDGTNPMKKLKAYKWYKDSPTWVNIATAGTDPGGDIHRISVNPAGTLVATLSLTSPYISIYGWDGSNFSNPTTRQPASGYLTTGSDIWFSADGGALMEVGTTSPYAAAWPVSASGFGTVFGSLTSGITTSSTGDSTSLYSSVGVGDRVGTGNWVCWKGGSQLLQAVEISSAGWGSTRRTYTVPNAALDRVTNPVSNRTGTAIFVGAQNDNLGAPNTIYTGVVPWTDAGGFGTGTYDQRSVTPGGSLRDLCASAYYDHIVQHDLYAARTGSPSPTRTWAYMGESAMIAGSGAGTLTDWNDSIQLSAGQSVALSSQTAGSLYSWVNYYILEYDLPG